MSSLQLVPTNEDLFYSRLEAFEQEQPDFGDADGQLTQFEPAILVDRGWRDHGRAALAQPGAFRDEILGSLSLVAVGVALVA